MQINELQSVLNKLKRYYDEVDHKRTITPYTLNECRLIAQKSKKAIESISHISEYQSKIDKANKCFDKVIALSQNPVKDSANIILISNVINSTEAGLSFMLE